MVFQLVQAQRQKQKELSKNGKRLIVDRRDVLTVRCSDCHLPFLEIADGEIKILSKHGSKKHKNSLTIDHVKMLLVEMLRQQRPEPEYW